MKKQLQLLAIIFLITNMQSPLLASPFGLAWDVYSQWGYSNFKGWWNKVPKKPEIETIISNDHTTVITENKSYSASKQNVRTRHIPGKQEYRESLRDHAKKIETDWENREAAERILRNESVASWDVARYSLYAATGCAGLAAIALCGSLTAERFKTAEGWRIAATCFGMGSLLGAATSAYNARESSEKQKEADNYVPKLRELGRKNWACRERILGFDEESLKTLAEAKKTEKLGKFKKQLGLKEDEIQSAQSRYGDLFGLKEKEILS